MDITTWTCCPSENITSRWINNGTSTCAMEIVSSVVASLYVLIFGNYLRMQRHTEISSEKLQKDNSYHLQKFLLLLMPVVSVFNVILQAKLLYGYMIISTIASLIVYSYSVDILKIERHKILSNTTDGNSKILFGFWILAFLMENIVFINASHLKWPMKWNTTFERVETVLFISRYTVSLLIFSLGMLTSGIVGISYTKVKNESEKKGKEEFAYHENRPTDKTSWRNTWYNFKTIAIFLWPKEDILLQLRVIACFALLFVGNVTNLLKPICEKKILDSITETPRHFRWELIVICMGIDIFRSASEHLRSFLWNRIEQHTTCKVEIGIFRHLHSLSLSWHLKRKTGEVLRIMDRGTDALHFVLYFALFSILPTIVDGILAAVFFINIFDKWIGLIVFSLLIFYFVLLVSMTEWRARDQKRVDRADNDQRSRSVDSLLNFETVKYYGAESYEVDAYEKAILDRQNENWRAQMTSNIFYMLQNLVDNFGLLAGSLLSLHMVVNNPELTIGDYVLFTSYISNIQGPLNQIASCYRYVHDNVIRMQSLFDLLEEKPDIVDLPDATPLKIEEGRIQFSNVSFSYTPEKPVLKNVNFAVPPGKTVALVGPSGAGKTTITRLLFRFYDTSEGSILIDDQDIKTIKQHSLRKAIGVVPQDTVLFNDTIKYNIQYGKTGATDEEVIDAAKSADIHDRILTFPDGYKTKVGERGLRLSGGEKQRVAIARTILKAPKIVLLDEATSALDTQTERNIQTALNRVCANRTTVIIAHRLSTIIHADEILVMKEGEIVERGRHEDLLLQNGIYHDMWEAQFKKEHEVAEEKPSDNLSK